VARRKNPLQHPLLWKLLPLLLLLPPSQQLLPLPTPQLLLHLLLTLLLPPLMLPRLLLTLLLLPLPALPQPSKLLQALADRRVGLCHGPAPQGPGLFLCPSLG